MGTIPPLDLRNYKSTDTKINIYILSIFLNQYIFLIILIAISMTNVLSTGRNLPLKSTIYKNAA